jgi:anti-anti-sigma factor
VNAPNRPLEVDVSAQDDQVVLVLRGELDPHTAPALRDQIDGSTAESTRTLVLDVSGLRFIDSSGLRVIIGAQRDMAARQGRLLLRHPTETTRRLLEITGLAERIEIE